MHRIKKILAGLLSACLLLGLTACGGSPEEKADGWWLAPEEADTMLDIMEMDTEAGTMNMYSPFGNVIKSYDFEIDGDRIVADTEFGPWALKLDGDKLLDEEGVLFEKSKEPEFEKVDLFDGTWYRLGDTSTDPYVIQGITVQKDGENLEYTPMKSMTMVDGEMIPTGVQLSGEYPNPDLVRIPELPMFSISDFAHYTVYVREDQAAEMHEEAVLLETLMNDTIQSGRKEDTYYQFSLQPETFQITEYTMDAVGSYLPGTNIGGTWALPSLDTLILTYNDGSTDTVFLPTEGMDFDREPDIAESVLEGLTFTVDSLGEEFTVSGF